MFRPGWVPTLFMIFGVAVTVSLGFWQLGRHQDKQALKEQVLAGLDAPVLDGSDLVGDIEEVWFRKVHLTGRWVQPLALTAGRQEFGRVGYGVVQPLLLDNGTRVLVDRGWVPRDGLAEAMESFDQGGSIVTLDGQIRPVERQAGRKGLGCGTEAPKQALPPQPGRPETWPPGAWPELLDRLPEPRVDGIVLAGQPILAGEGKKPEPLPVDGYQPLPRMRDSLSYAFQWWTFGIMLIIVWGALGVVRARQAREG